MEPEKEIELTKPYDIYRKTLINLVYTHNWMNSTMKANFDPFNLTVQQYNILRILRGQGDAPATINLLKDQMLDKMCDASRIVERLVQKELVLRKVSEFDRRAVDISISQAGLDLLVVLDEQVVPKEILGGRLTDEELVQLNSLLERLRS